MFSVRSVMAGMLVVVSLLAPTSPASARVTDTGSKDCTGSGKVTPTVVFPSLSEVSVDVHKAGPEPQPTWSTAATSTGVQPQGYTYAFVSPYAHGNWIASTDGSTISASAQCSQRSGPTGVRYTDTLGDKSCSTSVYFNGFLLGEVWMSWKSEPGSATRNYVRFPDRTLIVDVLRTYTRDADIYDAKVHFLRGMLPSDADAWGDTALRCR